MSFLRTYLRAQALEVLLVRESHSRSSSGDGGPPPQPRPLIPALSAAAALEARSDGSGDLFSLRVGSPAAALAFGATPEDLLRQVLARETAPAQGRDGAALPTDWNRGWVGPVPLPGALMEVMAGAAMALRMRGEPRVALLVDDTAGSGSGDWHEGLNLAVVRRAPLVLVNHDLRVGGTVAGIAPMGERAHGYGFRAWAAEDSDPGGVVEVCRAAVSAARAGEGVQVVDVRAVTGVGPDHLAEALREHGTDAAAVAALREDAEDEMSSALARVVAEPPPGVEALWTPADSPAPAGLHRVRTPRPWIRPSGARP